MNRPYFDKWLDRPDNQVDLSYEEWLDNYVAGLEAQLETARKALKVYAQRENWTNIDNGDGETDNEMRWYIAGSYQHGYTVAEDALAQIDAGQKGGK